MWKYFCFLLEHLLLILRTKRENVLTSLHSSEREERMMLKIILQISLIHGVLLSDLVVSKNLPKRGTDSSVHGYLTERTCWWNEICKEEFQNLFRCKCPEWSFCRAPGRYYNAFCSMANTGYIWYQPRLREK